MNKQQKEFKSFYSIRKSSLGVASVAISTLLLLMSNGEAQAAKETGGTNTEAQPKTEAVASPSKTTEKAPEAKPVANAVSVSKKKLRPLLLKQKKLKKLKPLRKQKKLNQQQKPITIHILF